MDQSIEGYFPSYKTSGKRGLVYGQRSTVGRDTTVHLVKGASVMDDLLTVGDAARVLDLTPRYVQDLADHGRLPVLRTVRGTRLFKRSDVDRLEAERAVKRPQKGPAQAEREGGAETLGSTVETVTTA